MATSTRLRKNVLPVFTLAIDGAAATSYADDLKAIELKPKLKDKDDVTFAEAAAGTVGLCDVEVECIMSYDATSLYAALFEKAGKLVDVVYGPWGNAAPAATKPHFKILQCIINRPGVGNEAAALATDLTGKMIKITLTGTQDVTVLKA